MDAFVHNSFNNAVNNSDYMKSKMDNKKKTAKYGEAVMV